MTSDVVREELCPSFAIVPLSFQVLPPMALPVQFRKKWRLKHEKLSVGFSTLNRTLQF